MIDFTEQQKIIQLSCFPSIEFANWHICSIFSNVIIRRQSRTRVTNRSELSLGVSYLASLVRPPGWRAIEEGETFRREKKTLEEELGRKADGEQYIRRTILSRDTIWDASARPLRHVTLQTVDNEAIVAA